MTPLVAGSKGELKSLLMKVKEESEKNWFKTQHSQNEGQGIWSYHVMANRWGNSDKTLFWGVPKSLQMATEAMKLKGAWSLEEKLWKT